MVQKASLNLLLNLCSRSLLYFISSITAVGTRNLVNVSHQNNGHSLLQSGYMNNKLFFAATETATELPGYMEGAVVAAKAIAEKLYKQIKIS